eukprot:3502696-Lingulodinium_polyedra.AAC.1
MHVTGKKDILLSGMNMRQIGIGAVNKAFHDYIVSSSWRHKEQMNTCIVPFCCPYSLRYARMPVLGQLPKTAFNVSVSPPSSMQVLHGELGWQVHNEQGAKGCRVQFPAIKLTAEPHEIWKLETGKVVHGLRWCRVTAHLLTDNVQVHME